MLAFFGKESKALVPFFPVAFARSNLALKRIVVSFSGSLASFMFLILPKEDPNTEVAARRSTADAVVSDICR